MEHGRIRLLLRCEFIGAVALASLLATTLSPKSSRADEYYNFYSIRCFEELGAARIERVGLWNVRSVVWPIGGIDEVNRTMEMPRAQRMQHRWDSHSQSLKRLEEEQSLYVFGEGYGRYEEPPIRCQFPNGFLEITYEKLDRDYVTSGDPRVYYRGPMSLKVQRSDGKVIFENKTFIPESFQVQDTDGHFVYSVCGQTGPCVEKTVLLNDQ
ncbi:hypothetical protein [Dongia rigui]|uniref:Uncharacterized protein n=1 Tax=Dongia rigui TaxID=940149 RepID=A0ABU5DZ91_9PROT|nr:hypothetical protein [Dongia rigui]MDY0872652.1 hypothetical protein [Dongia rigui]